jgi:archaellum component FlaD/FlaE
MVVLVIRRALHPHKEMAAAQDEKIHSGLVVEEEEQVHLEVIVPQVVLAEQVVLE